MDNSQSTDGRLKKNMATLIILFISGALIYALPYFRSYYYDTFVECFHLTNTQMGSLGSAFGGLAILGYFLGGFCADRWHAKNLMTISLVVTGGLGFLLLLYPPYGVLFVIHMVWGITSILTFWCALVKAVRSLGNSQEQGKAFGIFEGGRGITNMIQSALVLGLFTLVASRFTDKIALSAVIAVYSVVNILLGILVFFLYKEPTVETSETKPEVKKSLIDVKALKKVLKMPTTWLQAIIIFCSYAMCCSYFYITPYTTAVFGATVVIGAAMGYFSQYVRPVGCFAAGFFADKFGSSKILLISYGVMIIGTLGVILTPGRPSLIWMLLIFIAAIYASMYACQSMHFAIMEESDYPLEITGTATAIVTPLGYSVELFAPIIAGLCLDRWAGATGYKVFFGMLVGLAIIGFIATIIWLAITKEKRIAIQLAKKGKSAVVEE